MSRRGTGGNDAGSRHRRLPLPARPLFSDRHKGEQEIRWPSSPSPHLRQREEQAAEIRARAEAGVAAVCSSRPLPRPAAAARASLPGGGASPPPPPPRAVAACSSRPLPRPPPAAQASLPCGGAPLPCGEDLNVARIRSLRNRIRCARCLIRLQVRRNGCQVLHFLLDHLLLKEERLQQGRLSGNASDSKRMGWGLQSGGHPRA